MVNTFRYFGDTNNSWGRTFMQLTDEQSMVFSTKDYPGKSEDSMWADIACFMSMLLKNGYIAVVREDDTDIIVVEYEHDNRLDDWGCDNPMWVTDEERDYIESRRTTVEHDAMRKIYEEVKSETSKTDDCECYDEELCCCCEPEEENEEEDEEDHFPQFHYLDRVKFIHDDSTHIGEVWGVSYKNNSYYYDISCNNQMYYEIQEPFINLFEIGE